MAYVAPTATAAVTVSVTVSTIIVMLYSVSSVSSVSDGAFTICLCYYSVNGANIINSVSSPSGLRGKRNCPTARANSNSPG